VEALTKSELRKIYSYLKRVYPGVSEQDDLADLIERIGQILKGDHRGRGKRG
jgi:hypothetical protein